MGTITSKLNAIQNSKIAIRNAIVSKGVGVPAGTPFRLYADKIALISGGGGGGGGTTIINSSNGNYDGGNSSSIYLSEQNINGGISDNNGDLSPKLTIDGGGSVNG